jgi:hypothetical protein
MIVLEEETWIVLPDPADENDPYYLLDAPDGAV